MDESTQWKMYIPADLQNGARPGQERHPDFSGFDGEQSFDRVPCRMVEKDYEKIVGIAWLAGGQ
ncbi:hypothetical protein BS630_15565 [Rhizobium laguerreae]|jgi:hypothetical protein|nr:hypothetical protein BS630_15565 [Rhizobium laguerreae]